MPFPKGDSKGSGPKGDSKGSGKSRAKDGSKSGSKDGDSGDYGCYLTWQTVFLEDTKQFASLASSYTSLREVPKPKDLIPFYKEFDDYGIFSNFYPHGLLKYVFICGNKKTMEFHLPSSEHAIMIYKALLMNDMTSVHRISQRTKPQDAKADGRRVQNWNQALWDSAISWVAFDVLRQKFQDPKCRALLEATKSTLLVEAAPPDRIWGVGMTSQQVVRVPPASWNGSNILGFSLMRVRAELLTV